MGAERTQGKTDIPEVSGDRPDCNCVGSFNGDYSSCTG